MSRKIAKAMLFATIVTSVLCAGTVSARQLRSEPKGFACGGSCGVNQPCAANCVCSFTTPFTAFCTSKLAGAAPAEK
ncbi:MAG TPA: hypothetical protein VH024_09100 [Candidatus Angelobacter sp.]|nr:hypothetical protein [Candidatus Angelobacter sp.]